MKNKAWRYVTALVVVLIILNPEMAELALFVDAIGLDIFLMLFEVQVVALIGVLFNNRIRPILIFVKRIITHYSLAVTWKKFTLKSGCLGLSLQGPAILMHVLVFSSLLSIVATDIL
jgi:hypothetical protein